MISIECFKPAYSFALFLSALCCPVGEAVIKQSLSILHLFKFLLRGEFAAPLWVPACTVLGFGGAGSDQSEFLRFRNFQGLSVGTANGPPEWDFLLPENCLLFERVHAISLTLTCSVCSGILTHSIKTVANLANIKKLTNFQSIDQSHNFWNCIKSSKSSPNCVKFGGGGSYLKIIQVI